MPKQAEQETVGALLDRATARLRQAGIPSPRLDARILLGFAMDAEPSGLLPGSTRPVSAAHAAAFHELVDGRLARRPVSHLVGRREFYGRDFRVTADVLDPRPDSECVVELALAHLDPTAPARVLDLGTGSGCLLLTLLAERPLATGLGVDVSEAALAIATHNALALDLSARASFGQGVWLSGVTGRFDLIISNPPYIPTRHIGDLAPEVQRHEPHLALDGGDDGLGPYRSILPRLPDHLVAGGVAVLEHGQGQDGAVAALARDAGLEIVTAVTDLGGVIRAIALKTAPPEKKALGNTVGSP